MAYRTGFIFVLALSVCLAVASADEETSWIASPDTPASWHDSSHWDNGLPGEDDIARIDNGGIARVDANSRLELLVLGSDAGESGTLHVSAGKLLSDRYVVGNAGNGHVVVTGGRLASIDRYGGNTFYVAGNAGSTGLLELTGGEVGWRGMMRVGHGGDGRVVQTGGSLIESGYYRDTLRIGDKDKGGGVGTYELSGDGVVSTERLQVRNGGFLQSGGRCRTWWLGVSTDVVDTGYVLSGGELEVTESMLIGSWEGSQFTQTGGHVHAEETKLEGGHYEMTGGQLNVDGPYASTGDIRVAEGGTMHIGAGSSVGGDGLIPYDSGVVTQSGGTVSLDWYSSYDTGRYDLTGGSAEFGSMRLAQSEFSQSGGDLQMHHLRMYHGSVLRLSGGTTTMTGLGYSEGRVEFSNDHQWNFTGQGNMDFTEADLIGASEAFIDAGPDTLLVFPEGFDPYAEFGSFTSAGVVHVVGNDLLVPAGSSVSIGRDVFDHLDLRGEVTLVPIWANTHYNPDLAGGAYLSAGARLDLGGRSLLVGNDRSGMEAGSEIVHGKIVLGSKSTGTFVQNGGTVRANISLSGANWPNTYELNAGLIDNTDICISRSHFLHNGGDLRTEQLEVRGSMGDTYAMTGGTASVGYTRMSADFHQSGGSYVTGQLLQVSGAVLELTGGTFEITSHAVMEGTLDFAARGGALVLRDGGTIDFCGDHEANFVNAANASITGRTNSLMMFPEGFDPYATFGEFDSDGVVHVAGEDFLIEAGQTVTVYRDVPDHIVARGTLIFEGSPFVDLRGGASIEGGMIDLNRRRLYVNGQQSGIHGDGLLTGGELFVGCLNSSGRFVQDGGVVESEVTLGAENREVGGIYEMRAGLLDTERLTLASRLQSKFLQTGGRVEAEEITVGDGSTYMISDGELTTPGELRVGWEATAVFLQSGGTVTTAELELGTSRGDIGEGSYVYTGGELNLLDPSDGNAPGSIRVSNGSLLIQPSYLAGATIHARSAEIGDHGHGILRLSEGELTIDEDLELGGHVGGSGLFFQSGGSASAGHVHVDRWGRLFMSDGQFTAGTVVIEEQGELQVDRGNFTAEEGITAAEGSMVRIGLGRLEVGASTVLRGRLDFVWPTGALELMDGSGLDLRHVEITGVENASIRADQSSLMLLPGDFDPSDFRQFQSDGLVHQAGSDLVIPESWSVTLPGDLGDRLIVRGQLKTASGQVEVRDMDVYNGQVWVTGSLKVEGSEGSSLTAGNIRGGTFTAGAGVSGRFTQTGGVVDTGQMRVGYGSETASTYELRDGVIHSQLTVTGAGRLLQTGGEVNGEFEMSSGKEAQYVLQSGRMRSRDAYLRDGLFEQIGGTLVADRIIFSGTDGHLDGQSDIKAGDLRLYSSRFEHSGGEVDLDRFRVGGSSTYVLSDGELSTRSATVSSGGGVLEQTGGIHRAHKITLAKYTSNTSGTYRMLGGELTVGTIQVSAHGEGLLEIAGGSVQADIERVGSLNSGAIVQTGGRNEMAMLDVRSNGSYTYAGGELVFRDQMLMRGTLDLGDADVHIEAPANTFVDFRGCTPLNGKSASFHAGPDSLVILDSTGLPYYSFRSFRWDGDIMLGGSPMTIPEGDEMALRGFTYDQPVTAHGEMRGFLDGSEFLLHDSLTISSTGVVRDLPWLDLRGDLTLAGGQLFVDEEMLGYDAVEAAYTQSGASSMHRVENGFRIAHHGTEAVYHMQAGTLDVGWSFIGDWRSTGTFEQTGGRVVVREDWKVAGNSRSVGIHNLSAGELHVAQDLRVGHRGQGWFNQSGGSVRAARLTIADNDGREGNYDLSGGELTTGAILFGPGEASFTQSGGSNTTGYLWINEGGQYARTGGTLSVSDSLTTHGTLDLGGLAFEVDADAYMLVVGEGGELLGCGETSIRLGDRSLAVFPEGFDPDERFKSFRSTGLVHTAGSTLTVADGQSVSGWGTIDDSVDVAGEIRAADEGWVHLAGGAVVRDGATVDLGSGEWTVAGGVSSIGQASVRVGRVRVGQTDMGEPSHLAFLHADSNLTVHETFALGDEAVLDVAEGAKVKLVGGEWVNEATDPDGLQELASLTVLVAGDLDTPTVMEAAGTDLGIHADWQDTFTLGTLIVGDGSPAKLVLADAFDNNGLADYEAMYVERLILAPGSVLELGDLNLYFRHASIDESASIDSPSSLTRIPEPLTLTLLSVGGLAVLTRRRRRVG